MDKSYREIFDAVAKDKKDIAKTFKNVAKKKGKKMDDTIHGIHDKIFNQMDCLKCANCCKTTSPIFRDVDIKRLAKYLRVTEVNFIKDYLRIDEDNDYVLKSSPCLFLEDDNTCSVYEHRPLACREYPHTDRKNMFQIVDLTIRNLDVCPAVGLIVKEFNKNC